VNHTSTGRTDCALVEVSAEKLPIFDEDIFVSSASPGVLVTHSFKVDLGDDQREDLLACPERLWTKNCGCRKLVILIVSPHKQVHH
jgi:hypothetical protein